MGFYLVVAVGLGFMFVLVRFEFWLVLWWILVFVVFCLLLGFYCIILL